MGFFSSTKPKKGKESSKSSREDKSKTREKKETSHGKQHTKKVEGPASRTEKYGEQKETAKIGKREKETLWEQFNKLTPEGQKLLKEQLSGGGIEKNPLYNTTSQYLENAVKGTPESTAALEQPLIEEFNQKTLPGIAQRFAGAGTGAGASSSSAMYNQLKEAARGLGTNIASLRSGNQMKAAGLALPHAQQAYANQLGLLGVDPFVPLNTGEVNQAATDTTTQAGYTNRVDESGRTTNVTSDPFTDTSTGTVEGTVNTKQQSSGTNQPAQAGKPSAFSSIVESAIPMVGGLISKGLDTGDAYNNPATNQIAPTNAKPKGLYNNMAVGSPTPSGGWGYTAPNPTSQLATKGFTSF